MKHKGWFYLLALCLLLTGLLLISNLSTSASLVSNAPHASPLQSALMASPDALPSVSGSIHHLDAASVTASTIPTTAADSQANFHLAEALTVLNPFADQLNTRFAANALLLPAMADLIGLSVLVLRE